MLTKENYSQLVRNYLFGFTGISYSPWEDTLMLVADRIQSAPDVSRHYYTLFIDDGSVDIVTTFRDGKERQEHISFEEAQKDYAFNSAIRALDVIIEWPCHIDIHHSEVPRWNFIYDEEYGDDSIGENFSGVIARSDGNYRCLFFHAFCDKDGDYPVCHIYDSILSMTQHENEICSYPWTPQNDSTLLNALNSLKNPQDYCGDDSPLRVLEFMPYDECANQGDVYVLVRWPWSQRFVGNEKCFFYTENSDGEFDSDLSQAVFVPEDVLSSLSSDEQAKLADGLSGRYLAVSFPDNQNADGLSGISYARDEDNDEDGDAVVFIPLDEVQSE